MFLTHLQTRLRFQRLTEIDVSTLSVSVRRTGYSAGVYASFAAMAENLGDNLAAGFVFLR
jgi:hypothetical protein